MDEANNHCMKRVSKKLWDISSWKTYIQRFFIGQIYMKNMYIVIIDIEKKYGQITSPT